MEKGEEVRDRLDEEAEQEGAGEEEMLLEAIQTLKQQQSGQRVGERRVECG